MLAMTIDLNVWPEFIRFLDKIVLIFCDLQFVDHIPKTCMAGKVMGQGFFP